MEDEEWGTALLLSLVSHAFVDGLKLAASSITVEEEPAPDRPETMLFKEEPKDEDKQLDTKDGVKAGFAAAVGMSLFMLVRFFGKAFKPNAVKNIYPLYRGEAKVGKRIDGFSHSGRGLYND